MTASSHLSNVWFSVTPLQVSHGQGCWVTTTTGEEYLDFAAGIAVNSTGHAHPAVAAAIGAQAQRFIHAQVNVFLTPPQEPWGYHWQIGNFSRPISTNLLRSSISTFPF